MPSSNVINLYRENIMDGTMQASARSFNPEAKWSVMFMDDFLQAEGAVDEGDPTQEFFWVLMVALRDSTLFTGPQNSMALTDSTQCTGPQNSMDVCWTGLSNIFKLCFCLCPNFRGRIYIVKSCLWSTACGIVCFSAHRFSDEVLHCSHTKTRYGHKPVFWIYMYNICIILNTHF